MRIITNSTFGVYKIMNFMLYLRQNTCPFRSYILRALMSKTHRQMFFDKQVHMKVWKDSMAGQNEEFVMELLANWGYKKDIDFFRQYPIANRYVVDFAFPDIKVILEVDGKEHEIGKKQKEDEKRDKFMRVNGWVVLRIPDRKLRENPSFWKFLIREIVEYRKKHPTVNMSMEDIYDIDKLQVID